MITKSQIEELSNKYQIDGFTIMREYLHLVFLSYLYKEKEGKKIFFKGGTAIRFLFDSSRFSEDLDFSTILKRSEIKRLLLKLERLMNKELIDIKIIPLYLGENTSRFRLKYKSADFKYPLVIRLDFNHIERAGKVEISPLLTEFPIVIFPLVRHLSAKEILAEKTAALIARCRGRDIYDVWFLLEKGVKLEKKLVREKLKKLGKEVKQEFWLNRVKSYSQSQLKLDLAQFLPRSQREITVDLKTRLIDKLTKFSFNR